MKIYKIFDNPNYFDRYTILIDKYLWAGKMLYPSIGMSEDQSPQGFNQYGGYIEAGPHLGKEITFKELPNPVQKAVKERLK